MKLEIPEGTELTPLVKAQLAELVNRYGVNPVFRLGWRYEHDFIHPWRIIPTLIEIIPAGVYDRSTGVDGAPQFVRVEGWLAHQPRDPFEIRKHINLHNHRLEGVRTE